MKKSFLQKLKTGLCLMLLAGALAGCASSDARAQYDDACEALEAGEYETAMEGFSAVAESGTLTGRAYRGLGLAQLFAGKEADACISFERSLLYADGENDAFLRDVTLYLAHARTLHGETDKAIELYTELLNKEQDAGVFFLRGRLLLQEDREDEAGADFDRAAVLADDYELFVNIFQVYEDAGKSADGAAYLEKALELLPADEDNYYERGLVQYYLQNYQEAKDILIEGVRENREDVDSIFLLGRVYLAMDDVPDARAVYTEHLENETLTAYAYNGLALCDMAEEDYEAALENIEAGLDKDADGDAKKGLLFNRIVVLEYLEKWDEAREQAAEYAALYPTDEQGLRENAFLESR